ncbi:GntR family transcriptional regulator [Seonamhaeicola sp. MEBiC1930]|uniref:GntR family transcriptional regulator n=1 Tax=Seonamhaeicola sp. MEBiC01930 TaxID=2976768 RepID=UPI00324DA6F1
MDVLKCIKIEEHSRVPKYQQIVDSVIHNISISNFNIDQKLPSINSLSEEFYLSRDTVEKAYRILKERNIITPIRGKGYYINRTKLISKVNILFLVNKLSSYKMRIYNSFVNTIGANSHTDFHVYHCDESLFLNLLDKNKGTYDYFVIMPHFKTEDLHHISFTEKISKAISRIPPKKLIILDNSKPEISEEVTEIFQDFENDIYNALRSGLSKIGKYSKLVLVYPEKAQYPYPRRILKGFTKFCVENAIDFEVLNEVYEDIILKKGDLFITIEESDLVNLVNQIREDEYVMGEDIGVISYNDTPLKELLGITVISTDFKVMGETAANMILNKQQSKIKAPFNFIDRASV